MTTDRNEGPPEAASAEPASAPALPPAAKSALADIEDHFAAMSDSYVQWAGADLDRIETLLRGLRAAPSLAADAVQQIFEIGHNIKGQGGTFGYELMTEIAHALCTYLKQRQDSLAPVQLDVIEQHAKAMKLILSRKITGAGGEVGAKLIRRLYEVAASSA